MPIAMDSDQSTTDHVEVIHTAPGSENDITADANAEAPSDAIAGSSADGKQRMKRMTLNDAQKYEICVYMKDEEERSVRPTNKAVATYILGRYNIKVDESTVSRLKQQAEARLSRDLSNPTAKRHRQVVFPELERHLSEYVQANKRKVAISDLMLLNKGKELRNLLNIPEPQMKFSDGWLNKFKVRHGLKAASIQKPARVSPTQSTQSNKRTSGSANSRGKSNISLDKPRQSGAIATALDHDSVDIAIQSPLSSSRLNTSTTNLDHDGTQLDVNMNLGASMDIDVSENDPGISMEQVLRQQSSRSTEMSNGNAVELIVNPTSGDASVIRMDLLSNVYGNNPVSSGAMPIEHQRQQTSRLLASSGSRSASHKASAAATQSNPTSSSQLDNFIPLTTSGSAIGTASLSALGLTGAGSEAGNTGTRPTPPVTAARASLSMRLADPIAAAFQPEPPVDFVEASQCVNTLRIFMQQQGFSDEQVEHLRDIYLTLKQKEQQQQQQASQQQF